jgi:hypothetical protein
MIGVAVVRRRNLTNADAMSNGAFVLEAATSSHNLSISNARQINIRLESRNAKEV